MNKSAPLSITLILTAMLLSGCGGGGDKAAQTSATNPPPQQPNVLPLPDNSQQSHYQILLFGNSHLRSHDFPQLLQKLIKTGKKASQVTVVQAPGGSFLDERYYQSQSRDLLSQGTWSHLILQGQKYSVSGGSNYPTQLTSAWVELAKAQQTTPVLYPEHAQIGDFYEGNHIYNILRQVQQQNPACLAPIPHAWQQLLTRNTDVRLHDADGNHANLQGVLLSALVLYEVITNSPADQLPDLADIDVPAQVQQQLRQQASATLQQYPACPK